MWLNNACSGRRPRRKRVPAFRSVLYHPPGFSSFLFAFLKKRGREAFLSDAYAHSVETVHFFPALALLVRVFV